MFLMSFGLLSQIFIVMPQVVLELRKKPLRKKKRSCVRSKGQQSEHFLSNAKLTNFIYMLKDHLSITF